MLRNMREATDLEHGGHLSTRFNIMTADKRERGFNPKV
jgi:hypothetical protein